MIIWWSYIGLFYFFVLPWYSVVEGSCQTRQLPNKLVLSKVPLVYSFLHRWSYHSVQIYEYYFTKIQKHNIFSYRYRKGCALISYPLPVRTTKKTPSIYLHSLSLCDKAAHITADKVVKFNQPAISRSRLAMSLSREAARGIFYPRCRGKVLKRTWKIYEKNCHPEHL